jgi:hypothetical protein
MRLRAARRAAPQPAPASRETRLALWPSMLAQASIEPRPTFPLGGRSPYPADEGFQ